MNGVIDEVLSKAEPVAPPAAEPAAVLHDRWPDPIATDAFHGLAGKVVRTIEPHTEADVAALLIQFLVAFGNCIGRGAHWVVGGDEHHGNLFAVLVGTSSKARKGTSASEIRRLFEGVGNQWATLCIKSGLSSAEGMIWQVRDPIYTTDKHGNHKTADPGVTDKRVLFYEAEFAQTLKQTERTGNTLSPVLRQAWERGNLESLTKNSPAKATAAHVSLVAHITNSELQRYLTNTETANGFANRILWCCVRRSKQLPDGGNLDLNVLAALRTGINAAVDACRNRTMVLQRDQAAAALWRQVYGELTAERNGLAAAICARGEAHVLRLAMLYALLDQAAEIRIEHLRAGLAVWRYCERSAECIFGDALGDQTADEIASALRAAAAGLTRNEIRDFFGRHKLSSEIDRAMSVLLRAGKVQKATQATGGRPAERWTWKADGARKAP